MKRPQVHVTRGHALFARHLVEHVAQTRGPGVAQAFALQYEVDALKHHFVDDFLVDARAVLPPAAPRLVVLVDMTLFHAPVQEVVTHLDERGRAVLAFGRLDGFAVLAHDHGGLPDGHARPGRLRAGCPGSPGGLPVGAARGVLGFAERERVAQAADDALELPHDPLGGVQGVPVVAYLAGELERCVVPAFLKIGATQQDFHDLLRTGYVTR